MKNTFSLVFLISFVSCAANWSYEGENGPQNWGNLREDYKFCKIGYNQSPIDVDFKKKSDAENAKKTDLKFNYSESTLYLENDKILFDRQDFIQLRKKNYYLNKLIFRYPSEHYLNSKQQILEMQIFHKNDSEQFLVLAVFVKIAKENSEINNLLELFEEKTVNSETTINFNKILNLQDETFFYEGSLTEPPCTEGVKWYVMKNAIEMSQEQVDKIITLILHNKTNARNLQEFRPELY